MAKKPVKKSGSSKAETKKAYPIAGTSIVPTQLFHVPARKPEQEGPWRTEADKLSWVDEATGMPCIILRGSNGTLSGYVAIGATHSLFGYDHKAIPADLGIEPHGGLNYSAFCDEQTDESLSVCHLLGRPRGPDDHGSRPEASVDEWWFGFIQLYLGNYAAVSSKMSWN